MANNGQQFQMVILCWILHNAPSIPNHRFRPSAIAKLAFFKLKASRFKLPNGFLSVTQNTS